MNYIYYCTDSYKSSLVLSFLFPFSFSLSIFLPLLSFSPFLSFPPLSFLFPFILLNVLQVWEAAMEVVWENTTTVWKPSHILYFAQFEKFMFSPSVLQINWDRVVWYRILVRAVVLACFSQKKIIITDYLPHSVRLQSNRFLRDVQAAVHLSENPWAWWLPKPSGLSRTAQKLNKLALLCFSLDVNKHLV